MGKTGWQVATFVMGMACIASTFSLIANKNALAQANEDLKAQRTTETVTVHEVHQIPCAPSDVAPAHEVVPRPSGARCLGGRLIETTASGWNTVLHKGRPVACTET